MVNIVDVDKTNLKEFINKDFGKDRLAILFERQHQLMSKYHLIEAKNGCLTTDEVPVNIQTCLGQQRLKDFAWRVTEEIGEAMNCLKNKPWKQSNMETDEMHYKEEIIDAAHFFIELCILSGIEADDLFRIYLEKNEVNKFRQRSNY
jgi:dimeric dUTPase (all-alpha-NTP-PPase superfamily)